MYCSTLTSSFSLTSHSFDSVSSLIHSKTSIGFVVQYVSVSHVYVISQYCSKFSVSIWGKDSILSESTPFPKIYLKILCRINSFIIICLFI